MQTYEKKETEFWLSCHHNKAVANSRLSLQRTEAKALLPCASSLAGGREAQILLTPSTTGMYWQEEEAETESQDFTHLTISSP